jgi:hypothetical protein
MLGSNLISGTITAGFGFTAPVPQMNSTLILFGGGHGISGKTSGQNVFDQVMLGEPNVLTVRSC